MGDPKPYSDRQYLDAVAVYVGDIYYSNQSYDGKIARCRTLAEVIVRRLLGIGAGTSLCLGSASKKLRDQGMSEALLKRSLRKLVDKGNSSTHTQKPRIPRKDDFDRVCDALVGLYAYLFFDYFKSHPFGGNVEVVGKFSLLPPYFRALVLGELVLCGHGTVESIGKLSNALVKANGPEKARAWVEENRVSLSTQDVIDRAEYLATCAASYVEELGTEMGMALYLQEYQRLAGSPYDMLSRDLSRAEKLAIIPEELRYRTFEEAKAFYLDHGMAEGDCRDVVEFNALMRFVYEGRRAEGDDVIRSDG